GGGRSSVKAVRRKLMMPLDLAAIGSWSLAQGAYVTPCSGPSTSAAVTVRSSKRQPAMVATATRIRTSPRRYIDRRGAPAFRPRSSLTLRDRGRLSRAVDVIDARNMPDRLKAASRKPRGGRGDL